MPNARIVSAKGLVHEQTRVINRMKSALIQFGVRNFNPKLRKASEKLETVRTPEGKSLPPNTDRHASTGYGAYEDH